MLCSAAPNNLIRQFWLSAAHREDLLLHFQSGILSLLPLSSNPPSSLSRDSRTQLATMGNSFSRPPEIHLDAGLTTESIENYYNALAQRRAAEE